MFLLQKNKLVVIHEDEDDIQLDGTIIAKRIVPLPLRRPDSERWIPSGKQSILSLSMCTEGYHWLQLQSEWEDAEGTPAPLLGTIGKDFDTMGNAIRAAQRKDYITTRNDALITIDESREEEPTIVGLTTHHLFTNPEVREALVKMYGEPVTPEEEVRLKKEMARVRKWMPTYEVSEALHRRIHGTERMQKIPYRKRK